MKLLYWFADTIGKMEAPWGFLCLFGGALALLAGLTWLACRIEARRG